MDFLRKVDLFKQGLDLPLIFFRISSQIRDSFEIEIIDLIDVTTFSKNEVSVLFELFCGVLC